ncbi:hypothetical protein BU15DRAFT_76217 [Melanogaster broomeanus]|nr:hypothetical protein BU15DRAFT_76217 [Melanogaster broomeanus]
MYSEVGTIRASGERIQPNDDVVRFNSASSQDGHATNCPTYRPFHTDRRSFVYGLQPRAIQGMLDFDFSCTTSRNSTGTPGRLLPVYTSLVEAVKKHPDVDVVVNFASSRSVYSSTRDFGEGQAKGVLIIGPATVGGSNRVAPGSEIREGRRQTGSIRRERDTVHLVRVLGNLDNLDLSLCIPDPYQGILPSACNRFVVRRVVDCQHPI